MKLQPDNVGSFVALSAQSKNEAGQPVCKFRKELVSVGKLVQPSSGSEFDVTSDMIDNWVVQFNLMAEREVDVSIPSTHDGAGDPDKNRGYVESMFRVDDRLVMTCEMIGEDAIIAAGRNDVSIFSPPTWVDGRGNSYQQPITHVALTPEPLVPGLGSFVTIAASRTIEAARTMNAKKFLKALGIEGDVSDDKMESAILDGIKALKKSATESDKKLKASLDQQGKPTGDDPKSKAGDDKKPETTVTPMILSLARKSRTVDLTALVSCGAIDESTRKKLESQYVKDETLTASLTVNGFDDGFDALVASLRGNKPVSLGEHSGMQAIKLHDELKGDDNSANVLIDGAKRMAEEHKEQLALSQGY